MPEKSRFENRDYHNMLTLQKLAISPIISKCHFFNLKFIQIHNFCSNAMKLHSYVPWVSIKLFYV